MPRTKKNTGAKPVEIISIHETHVHFSVEPTPVYNTIHVQNYSIFTFNNIFNALLVMLIVWGMPVVVALGWNYSSEVQMWLTNHLSPLVADDYRQLITALASPSSPLAIVPWETFTAYIPWYAVVLTYLITCMVVYRIFSAVNYLTSRVLWGIVEFFEALFAGFVWVVKHLFENRQRYIANFRTNIAGYHGLLVRFWNWVKSFKGKTPMLLLLLFVGSLALSSCGRNACHRAGNSKIVRNNRFS